MCFQAEEPGPLSGGGPESHTGKIHGIQFVHSGSSLGQVSGALQTVPSSFLLSFFPVPGHVLLVPDTWQRKDKWAITRNIGKVRVG